MRLLFLFLFFGFYIRSVSGQASPYPNVMVWNNGQFSTNVPADLTNAVSIAEGGYGGYGSGYDFYLAAKTDGSVECWGPNAGELGTLPNFTNAIQVCAGADYAAVLKSDGSASFLGTLNPEALHEVNCYPAVSNFVTTLSNVVSLSLSPFGGLDCGYTLGAIKADGSILIQFPGTGTTPPPSTVTNVVAIAAGNNFFMALDANGRVSVWGDNTYGQTNVPVLLKVKRVSAIAAGATHCLALETNGTVLSWGSGPSVPVGLSNVVAIAAGDGFSMALLTSGSIVSWGITAPTNMPVAQQISASYDGLTIVNPSALAPPPAPVITTQPLSQTVGFGSTTTLLVGATGYGPFSYQWYFDGTNAISGATNRFLVITNVQTAQIGQYTVSVANAGGSVASSGASINALPSLDINMIPGILITGGIGLSYDIQYINAYGPTNATWTTLNTVVITNSPQYYFDVTAVGQPKRFYRTISP